MYGCIHVGGSNEIIPSLIDIGLDVINLQQPRALNIEAIVSNSKGAFVFESLCDIQHTLPFKDAAAIQEEAHLLLEHWATPTGGFILSDYGEWPRHRRPFGKKADQCWNAFLDADPISRKSW